MEDAITPLAYYDQLKSQHTIKAQSLEATLPTMIVICEIFCMPLPEQDTTRKGRVYEIATKYILTFLFCYIRDCYLDVQECF